jgi:pimeloyl-ACP methyl ester carboxylesterase
MATELLAPEFLARDGVRLAYRRIEGKGPTVVWLGGFRSDMIGAKAEALAAWARRRGRAFLRFDYFGHGESEGAFEEGTIGRWRGDALLMIDRLTDGPLVLVGSSMGGWLACLVAAARPERVKALALVAPAADFTSALMEPGMDPEARHEMARTGVWLRPSDYGDPYPITKRLIEEGRAWSVLDSRIAFDGPVRILQGQEDPDVPWRHALRLADNIASPDVVFTLVKDGDHRLSRPQDLKRLQAAVQELVG